MGFFKRKPDIRADTGREGKDQYEDALLRAFLGKTEITKETAMQIPTVASCIDLIAAIVAGTPIMLYKETEKKTEPVKDDPRVRILNDETGDTLNGVEFWKAILRDYYLGKGGYAYINKSRNRIVSLHYVDEARLSVQMNTDPIFKDYNIFVDGRPYKPWDFLKILRNTKDGASGTGIVAENSKVLEVAYESLIFERNQVKKGGNKKGFLKSEKRLEDGALEKLKEAFRILYTNDNSENAIVLNGGIDFKESSNTAVEMQLNENKESNAKELCKIFHVSPDVIAGKAAGEDMESVAKLAAVPLMKTIECALNKDFLFEREKGFFYWAFDTKQLLKGNLKERMEAYGIAIDKKIMSPNEVRFEEDLTEVPGMDIINMGLADVIFDIKTGTYFTPNTKKVTDPKKGDEEGGE